MIFRCLLATLALLVLPVTATAQGVATEADVTVGGSSTGQTAGAAQVRVFGSSKSDWRFFAEAALGTVRGPVSDAFASVYPYDGRLRPMESYVERMFHSGDFMVGVRGGRYRTPFGISGRSDHAYLGFTRAPLIRYGKNWALSNTFLEAGGDVLVGTSRLFVEASVGAPLDEGGQRRESGTDVVVRGQGYYKSLILGVSSIRSEPSERQPWIHGKLSFRGVDARWMYKGVQLRGEWIDGQPFDDTITRGGYVDVILHRPVMGPVTAVARVERLDYYAGQFSEYLRRYTVGARVRITPELVAVANVVRDEVVVAYSETLRLDVGFTYSFRF